MGDGLGQGVDEQLTLSFAVLPYLKVHLYQPSASADLGGLVIEGAGAVVVQPERHAARGGRSKRC
jgi:hypothetical protein